MKKRLYLTFTILIAACLILTGCQSNKIEEEPEDYNEIVEENTATGKIDAGNNKIASKELTVTENPEIYNDDLPLGFECKYPTVNGKSIVVKVETTGDSKKQSNGPYYISYRVYVGEEVLNTVKEGKYHLEGYGIEMLKTFDIEEDAGTNYEFFEWDFTTSVYKGQDKEYVAISIPAGTEDKNQASLILSTDDGKLLGDFTADIVKDITLTGSNIDKYKNWSGDYVFNSIKDGVITYLTPTDGMYKINSEGKKILDNSLDVLELEEHLVTINNDKATDEKTGEIYQITNAKGRDFGFGEFRH